MNIKLNTYNAAGRFDLDDDQAEALFTRIEARLTAQGHEVERVCQLHDEHEYGTDEQQALDAAFEAEGY